MTKLIKLWIFTSFFLAMQTSELSDERVEQILCQTQDTYTYANGIQDLVSSAALEFQSIPTSIVPAIERHHTVVSVGTQEGNLLKVRCRPLKLLPYFARWQVHVYMFESPFSFIQIQKALPLDVWVLSAEIQKGVNAVWRCSVENQKGAIDLNFVQW